MRQSLKRLQAKLCCGLLAAGQALWAGGVTLITHGWNPGMAGTPAWPAAMRAAMAARYANSSSCSGTITVTGQSGQLTALCEPWDIALNSGHADGEVFIILDWSAIADHQTSGVSVQETAAAVLNPDFAFE